MLAMYDSAAGLGKAAAQLMRNKAELALEIPFYNRYSMHGESYR